MKAQLSFFSKIMMLVLSISSLLFLMYIIENFYSQSEKEEMENIFREDTLTILKKLVSTEECLAYSFKGTPEISVLDINKVENFSTKYKNLEPRCAKATYFDYFVEIEDTLENKNWKIGVFNFSKGKRITLTFPVSIKYNDKKTNPGKIRITATYGNFEKFASYLEMFCLRSKREPSLKETKEFYLDYSVEYRNNMLCSNKVCKKIDCEKKIVFEKISKGEKTISFSSDETSIYVKEV